jgi:hypothetical protein
MDVKALFKEKIFPKFINSSKVYLIRIMAIYLSSSQLISKKLSNFGISSQSSEIYKYERTKRNHLKSEITCNSSILTGLIVRFRRTFLIPNIKEYTTMKGFKSLATVFAVSAIACIPILFSTQSASAATGMDGSYIGVGINGDGSGVLPAVTGRIDFKNSPISIRATATGACESDVCATLVIPTVTYDIGVAKDVNIYAGGGAEGAVSKDVVLYADATYFTNGGGALWKAGVGYRF